MQSQTLYSNHLLNTIKDTLIGGLLSKLAVHHSVYRLPCTSEYLEELVSNTLNENGMPNDWKPDRSHSVSIDMTLDSGESISVKSGRYDPIKRTLVISGSRLGKHETLEKMVESVASTHADYYVCLAKADQDWSHIPSKNDMKTYYLFVFEASNLDYSFEHWSRKESKHGKGYKYVMEIDGMSATIRSTMSHQLWTTISEDIISSPTKLDIM
jgi:hypothetical protein